MSSTLDCGLEERKPTWREMGWCDYAYVNPQGRIVGKVEKLHRAWAAYCEGRDLGLYVDESFAKAAVITAYERVP